jgi:hypothetical protein
VALVLRRRRQGSSYGDADYLSRPADHITAINTAREISTDLTLTARVDIGGGDVINPAMKIEARTSLCSMVGFSALKRLQIPWAFLVGFMVNIATDDLQPQDECRRQSNCPQWGLSKQSVLDVLEAWLGDPFYITYAPHLHPHL